MNLSRDLLLNIFNLSPSWIPLHPKPYWPSSACCAFAKPESPPLFHPPVEIHVNKAPQAYQWLRLPIPEVLSLVQGLVPSTCRPLVQTILRFAAAFLDERHLTADID